MDKAYSKKIIKDTFNEHLNVAMDTLKIIDKELDEISEIISKSLKSNGTIFLCGNGGSAADSQHIAAEFVGRFKKNRKPLRSLALTTDTSILTCISNDYNFDDIFSRQLNALGRKDDVLIAITTSGQSCNIKKVLIEARRIGIKTICLLGKGGGDCKELTDIPLVVPSDETARIQEMHILIGHLICELVEKKLGFE
jgi:D-sedoheptulose 7-phosphate isomerase